jgi:archaellum component FlaC
VNYNFTVNVEMVPYITCVPDMGYVGDQFQVTGTNFLDYVGQYITLYFENGAFGSYTLLWNETITSSGWTTTPLTVPQSWGGPRRVEARIQNGTVLIAFDIYTVLAMIDVIPDCINNTVCQVVQVEGTGFHSFEGEMDVDFFVYIDNELYFGEGEDWEAGINSTGYVLFEFAAAGFRPGLHVVSVIMDTEGNTPWTIYTKDNFCVTTVGDPIVEYLVSLNMTMADLEATIISVNGTVATLDTTVGQLQVDLTAIGATVTSIEGDVATIQTTLGSIQTSLTSMNAKLTSIQNDVANIEIPGLGTIETKLDTLDAVIGSMYGDVVEISTTIGTFETTLDALDAEVTAVGNTVDSMDTVVGVIAGDIVTIDTVLGAVAGTVTDMEGTLATIETDLGTVKVDLATAKTDIETVQEEVDTGLPVDMLPVWIAVVLALIAAIGSIAGVFIIQRKIA